MYITVAGVDYELSTSLGTLKSIEKKVKLSFNNLFAHLKDADSDELVDMLSIARKDKTQNLQEAIFESWDYTDLTEAVQELLIRITCNGTPEQNEAKIERSSMTEEQKNVFRATLGLPVKDIPGLNGGNNY